MVCAPHGVACGSSVALPERLPLCHGVVRLSLALGPTGHSSRLDQLVKWCGGELFDGCLIFDECHKAKNFIPVRRCLVMQYTQHMGSLSIVDCLRQPGFSKLCS